MKTVYKIYYSSLAKEEMSGYSHVTPARSPDFLTEAEAEECLNEELQKQENDDNFNYYYFIQKTFIKE